MERGTVAKRDAWRDRDCSKERCVEREAVAKRDEWRDRDCSKER